VFGTSVFLASTLASNLFYCTLLTCCFIIDIQYYFLFSSLTWNGDTAHESYKFQPDFSVSYPDILFINCWSGCSLTHRYCIGTLVFNQFSGEILWALENRGEQIAELGLFYLVLIKLCRDILVND
tara:strand:+ start:143 stop:517 length:375 start_codon:yes stop_codon:yes gene_type:complete